MRQQPVCWVLHILRRSCHATDFTLQPCCTLTALTHCPHMATINVTTRLGM
jgi:hypothetical protein